MTNEQIAAELIRLKQLSDTTFDGQPDGYSETAANLEDFFIEHFDAIVMALLASDRK